MELTLGTRLRQHRERRQISLAAISDETKIKLSLLDGLERDDVSQWPEGIFRRAWVRTYARAIGLDPADVVREFLERYPDPADIKPDDIPVPPPTGVRGVVASVMRRRGERREAAVMPPAPPPAPARDVAHDHVALTSEIDLPAVADLCTRIARATEWSEVAQHLEETSDILEAVGLTVWSWQPRIAALRPVWAHGYSDAAMVKMPAVRIDADNAVAVAFRSGKAAVVSGDGSATGAVVVPMVTPAGCVAVLAIELRDGSEQSESVCAVATIVAAQVASVLGAAPLAEAATA
jgi:hypothetical protein